MVGQGSIAGATLVIVAAVFFVGGLQIWNDNALAASELDREADRLEQDDGPNSDVRALEASEAASAHREAGMYIFVAGTVIAAACAIAGTRLLSTERRRR